MSAQTMFDVHVADDGVAVIVVSRGDYSIDVSDVSEVPDKLIQLISGMRDAAEFLNHVKTFASLGWGAR